MTRQRDLSAEGVSLRVTGPARSAEASARDLAESLEALEASRREIQRLEGELAEAREAVRRALGAELHDDLGPVLTGMAFLARSLLDDVPADLAPAAARLLALANESLERAHRLAEGQMPDGTIEQHLRDLARTTSDTFGIECVFVTAGDFRALDAESVHHLQSIAREAVNNAVRHSKGRCISIELTQSGDRRVLTVRDDGRGLSPVSARKGLGLGNMSRRARSLGGTLELLPAAGGGTEVRCAW